jgi:hypothetical protein
MSRPRSRCIPAACAVALIASSLALAPRTAMAVPDFDENFEEMTLGELVGQNGWTGTLGEVEVLGGPGVDGTLVVHGVVGLGVAEAERLLPNPFHYTTADTAIVWGCWAFAGSGGCNKDALAGPSGHATPDGVVFGINVINGQPPTTFLSCTGTRTGDLLQFGHWYEFRVVANFAVPGGAATLQYRDVTLGQTTFTVDGTLHNANLGQGTDGSGTYPFLEAYTRVDDQCIGGCFVDRIHVGAPGSSVAGVEPGAAQRLWSLDVSPNPARVANTIAVRYATPERARVRIAAFDAAGRRVGTLLDTAVDPGTHALRWDVRGDGGEPLPAGLYFLRLEAGGRKLVTTRATVQ